MVELLPIGGLDEAVVRLEGIEVVPPPPPSSDDQAVDGDDKHAGSTNGGGLQPHLRRRIFVFSALLRSLSLYD